ncbi:DNA translocase FtsK [Granulicatella adiacens ATCC 49175]|uniref:DNA translocase FtsK n=1 Tax=Granulicatella adiacens ATCC 49175 TaxID=638301 RepID=C8NEC2_9LACT|nr:DNA translocase FtsK [Granulicatella adiacens]EEW38023.1 FtsK/SpoIIIE family protein [Granulicatella adiacens ATCC 49175]UAK93846.1 DNA translocase FtsK [Granulicatella adiacens]UWP38920.1 DNA translocase FtsK [Granulicatella adiacens ATCC 49175]
MAKQTKKKTSRSKNTQNSNPLLSIEALAVFLIVYCLLAIFQLGFLGKFFANVIRFFIGDLFVFGGICGILAGFGMLFRGRMPKIIWRWTVAAVCSSIALLLFVSVMTYSSFTSSGSPLFQEMMNRFMVDFTSNMISQNLGGGLIGTLLYAGTYFLVSQWGTYLLVFLLLVCSALLIFDIHLSDVMNFVRTHVSNLSQKIAEKKAEKEAKQKALEEEDLYTSNPETHPDDSLPVEEPVKEERKEHSLLNRMKNAFFDDYEDESMVDTEQELYEPVYSEPVVSPEPVPPVTPVVSTPSPIASKTQENSIHEDDAFEDDGEDIGDLAMGGEENDEDYQLPPVTLLNPVQQSDQSNERTIVERNMRILERTFASFGVDAKVMPNPMLGPAVTKYEIQPAIGVKVSKIVNLSDDIALALAAKDIRIEAPIPGKPYVGIEVPNSQTSFVSFSDVIQSAIQSPKPLDVPLGRDISGNVRLCDITKMPHMLIAGSTGSGKSVCINGIITSILMKTKPHEVKLMMIDPKMVELNVYNGIPHLLTPVVTNPRKAAQALQKVVAEMEKRYELFASMGMRNIDGYNAHVEQYNRETGENNPTLPYIVVIVDELADLMMVASNEVEDTIIRLAQMARAAGIHMILATQRPSVDVITGIIKANVPSRIAFAVSSGTDSRTIIDANGAEKLLGRGDMLYMPMGENKPIRVQGAFLTDEEVERIVDFVKNQQEVEYDEAMMPSENTTAAGGSEPEDELFYEVIELLKEQETISTSYLQRRFRIGFNRAARMIDDLEARGYVGPADGSKGRKVNVHVFSENNASETTETNT